MGVVLVVITVHKTGPLEGVIKSQLNNVDYLTMKEYVNCYYRTVKFISPLYD